MMRCRSWQGWRILENGTRYDKETIGYVGRCWLDSGWSGLRLFCAAAWLGRVDMEAVYGIVRVAGSERDCHDHMGQSATQDE